MNIRTQLLLEHSKENTQKIADYIGKSRKRYKELWEIIKHAEAPIPQRGSWVLSHSPISFSPAVIPFIPEMIEEVQKPVHDAIKRNVMKIIATIDEIPEEVSASFFDLCIDWAIDKNTSIAIKVYSMEIAGNIAMPYEELRNEVIVVIEDQMEHGSAAIKSRGRRLLKKLRQI